VSTGVNDGSDYGGGFYWAGGGVGTNDKSPSTLGMAFSSPSTYFGMQLVCGKGTCTAPALMAVGAFALYVRETSGPTFNSSTGLWQTSGWIRGAWPFVLAGGFAVRAALALGKPQRAADRYDDLRAGRLELASVRSAGNQSVG
jgi:hypothetical protein